MSERPRVVIVDQWALMRLGIGTVARAADLRVVGEADRAADGLLAARSSRASALVLGLVGDTGQVAAVRDAKNLDPPPAILVLVERPTREQLSELFSAGADGVLPRSSEADAVADAIVRVVAGERVIAPSLLPALVGMLGEAEGGPGTAAPDYRDGPGAPALTSREREVLRALADGHTNREIADRLYVTEATVKTHLANLYGKLGASNRRDAVLRAVALGVLE